ncbi:MAG: methionine adenosyltransferase [Gammaproteobacteria bacterium]
MKELTIFTSESITAGHPDKLCDQVSDAIVDHFLARDPLSTVDAECAVASGILFLSVHYASSANLNLAAIARNVIGEAGYPKSVFDAHNCSVMTSIKDQSGQASPVDLEVLDDAGLDRVTARQQVTVFGYACDQTAAMMPLPIWLAHRLAERMDSAETFKKIPYLLPDGKTQVAIGYRDGKILGVSGINLVASLTESSSADLEQLRGDLIRHVVRPVLKKESLKIDEELVSVNPEGLLIGGGPAMHSGLTGRKTGMDTYGGYCRQSGAALSGKDPLRIDRVGAYIARYAAKNIVAAGLARECELQLSYSPGSAAPLGIEVQTFGTGAIEEREIVSRLREVFDFRLGAIVRDLRLRQLPSEGKQSGFYKRLASYGQMGRVDLDVPWEQTDKAKALK